MIIDLKKLSKENIVQSKICIIGGGTVGLFLANKLKEVADVTVIEEGSEIDQGFKNSNYVLNKSNYKLKGPGYHKKKFTLGGLSTIWGGQMIPPQKSDIQNRNYIGVKSWNIKFKEIYKYYKILSKSLKIRFLEKELFKLFGQNNKDKNFNLRFSVFLRKKKKNFYSFYKKQLKHHNLKIYTNAKVIKIIKAKNTNLIKKVIARSENTNTLTINADLTIICCGTIESTRLLFLFNKFNKKYMKKNNTLGHFFCEQLSYVSAKLSIKDKRKFILNFSPIYKYGLLHNPRLELSSNFQKENKLPSAYYHLLPFQERRVNFQLKYLFNYFFFIITNIFNFLYFRIINKRLWFRRSQKILLLINIEQVPSVQNRIMIFSKKVQKKESERLDINYKIQKKIFKDIIFLNNCFKNYWIKSGFNKIADIKFFKSSYENIKKTLKITYHPSGTIRIGSNSTNSSCDKNLKYWGINNLYICSTAVFPSVGSSNTGFMLLVMASRLAYHIKKKIKNKKF